MRHTRLNDFIISHFIPRWYKDKYSDRIGNRKHASGYWFNFILPREIVNYPVTKYTEAHLVRWLNFYFTLHSHLKGDDLNQ